MLTERGTRAVQAIVLLSVISLLSGNPTLISASLTVIMLLLVDAMEFAITLHFVKKIRIERVVAKLKLRVGDETDVTLRISNMKHIATSVAVDDRIPMGLTLSSGSNSSILRPTRGDAIEVDYCVKAHQMGDYELGDVGVNVPDGLGLMTAEIVLKNRTSLHVYPQLKLIPPLPVPRIQVRTRSTAFGQKALLEPGIGTDFYGVRDYHPGDDLKHVAWKAVARAPQHPIMTREFEATRDETLILALDAKKSMLDGPVGHRKLDYIVESIIALVNAACAEDFWLSVVFGCRFLTLVVPGKGRHLQMADAMKSVYNISPSDSFKLQDLVDIILLNRNQSSKIVLVTDCESNDERVLVTCTIDRE